MQAVYSREINQWADGLSYQVSNWNQDLIPCRHYSSKSGSYHLLQNYLEYLLKCKIRSNSIRTKVAYFKSVPWKSLLEIHRCPKWFESFFFLKEWAGKSREQIKPWVGFISLRNYWHFRLEFHLVKGRSVHGRTFSNTSILFPLSPKCFK